MTRTVPLAHHLDDSRLSRACEASQTATAAAPAPADLSRYHHPHFISAAPGPWEGQTRYKFAAFTGTEPKPEAPLAMWHDKTVTREQRYELSNQYQAARILWSHARLRREATPHLHRAATLWDAWTTAQNTLRATFEAFWDTEDNAWRRQLLRLTDAERAAHDAAATWDTTAGQLVRLAYEQRAVAGEMDELTLKEVARELGYDASDWDVHHLAEDYEPSTYFKTPLVARLARQIDDQRARLREVEALVGQRSGT